MNISSEQVEVEENPLTEEETQVQEFCDSLFSTPDWQEIFEELSADSTDFEVGNVRFIQASQIDRIQQEELRSDPYILGSFDTYLLADILECPIKVIEKIKEAEAFDALGEWVLLKQGALEEFQNQYASQYGYGDHFNSYNSSEEEFTFREQNYFVFDNH